MNESAKIKPETLKAPMQAVVHQVNVAVGDVVAANAELVVLEAMKMHHEIKSPCQGVLKTLNVRLHQVIDITDLMATVEPVKALSDERVCHE